MPLDLTSPEAQEVLSLSQTKTGKLLTVAVRESQGRTRVSWAPDKRPAWWKERMVLTMPGGERVTTLPFGSKYKMNWGLTETQVTYLMYLFRDDLGAIGEQAAEGEAPQAAESPKLVKVRDEEEGSEAVEARKAERPRRRDVSRRKPPTINKPILRRRKADPSRTHPVSERGDTPAHQLVGETPSAAESVEEVDKNTRRRKRVEHAEDVTFVREVEVASRTRSRRAKAKPPQQPVRRTYPRRGKAQPAVTIVVSDEEDDSASTGPESPGEPASRGRVASDARDINNKEMDGEGSERATEEQEDEKMDREREKAGRVAAIVAEQAKFNKNVKKALAEFRRKAKLKRLSMARNHEKQQTALVSALGVIKLKNYPQRVLDMAMSEYVTEYDADARQRLMKDTIRQVTLVVDEEDTSDEPHRFAYPARTPHDQARRDQVTATIRKTKRAVRERQEEFAARTGSRRTRPQRSAAKTAAKRTQAMLQGSAIRRAEPHYVRGTGRKLGLPPVSPSRAVTRAHASRTHASRTRPQRSAVMATPAEKQANASRAEIVKIFLETIQKQPNPQAAMEKLEEDPSGLFAEVRAQLPGENVVHM